MKRRAVLTGFGATIVPLTGCTGFGAERNTKSPAGTETPPSYSGRSEVQASTVKEVPTDVPLEPSVKVIQSSITADKTARIRVTLTNTSDQTVWNTNVRIPTFSAYITQAGPQEQKLVLLRPGEQYETASAECWRAELDNPQLNHAYTDVATDVRYTVGEKKATEFAVYGHPENDNRCIVLGEYPIKNRYTIATDDEAEEAEWEYEWGFGITVTES